MKEWLSSIGVELPNMKQNKGNSIVPSTKTLASVGVLTSSFFLLQNVVQRLSGRLGLYAGRATPITAGLGMVATSINMCASNYASLEFENYWDKHIDKLPFYKCKTEVCLNDVVRRTALGLSAYMVLEGGLFRTSFPSSSISLGAYANSRSTLRSSIISNSPVASESQRRRIQQLGRRFGCHQCGSRQIFSKRVFIADHMPPTKRAEQLSAVWWRKLLNIKVTQRLWPQCQKCFSIQGNAVRIWSHFPIYHSNFRIHHLAPLGGLLLDQNEDLRQKCDEMLVPISSLVSTAQKEIKKLGKSL